jgi:hypothetical protein
LDQFGIDNIGALVQIISMVLPDQLINKIKWRNHNVCSEDISLNDHRFGLHLGPGGNYAFLWELPEDIFPWKKNIHPKKKNPKVAKNNTNENLLVPQKISAL